jgi:hypothetical protein
MDGGTMLVVRGGPTPEETAAVLLALDAAAAADRDGERAAPPAWARAARVEGVGGRPRAGAADLRSLE